jgi:rhomboid family GlyGly-CTERM serine protease
MNTAAFVLCCRALLWEFSALKFLSLLLACCLSVSLGILAFNPEYTRYAGLSGVIHGLIVVGLCTSCAHPRWLRATALLLLAVKITQEQSANFHADGLQLLIPAAIAVDAHLYGALTGLLFIAADKCLHSFRRDR